MATKITSDNIDATIATAADLNKNAFNISLLGFKMAVNEGLTVFNLVDGIVDEFHDESGIDEAEGSNDTYCASNDLYNNANLTPYSSGFTISSTTESDTSTAGANPAHGTATAGEFTVPTGVSSIDVKLWGAGGGGADHNGDGTSCEAVGGGGGGYVEGTIATTPGTKFDVYVGEGGESAANGGGEEVTGGAFGGGKGNTGTGTAGGGGFSAIMSDGASYSEGTGNPAPGLTPAIFLVAGAGGGGGGHYANGTLPAFGNFGDGYDGSYAFGGAGGGLTGYVGGNSAAQTDDTNRSSGNLQGGGGGQSSGGQGALDTSTRTPGGFLYGGEADGGDANRGAGGGGFYGGGSGGHGNTPQPGYRGGGGGSSYYGNPAVSSGATSGGFSGYQTGRGASNDPSYANPASTEAGDGVRATPIANVKGQDGYALITCNGSTATTSVIVSGTFTANSVPTTSRIVVFEEDVANPTLNTDVIASISRDGGTTFTAATLSDSGYVTGSSGQRILTGQATISGQPSGQSMRWKLNLANNAVKIHGVSLQWS